MESPGIRHHCWEGLFKIYKAGHMSLLDPFPNKLPLCTMHDGSSDVEGKDKKRKELGSHEGMDALPSFRVQLCFCPHRKKVPSGKSGPRHGGERGRVLRDEGWAGLRYQTVSQVRTRAGGERWEPRPGAGASVRSRENLWGTPEEGDCRPCWGGVGGDTKFQAPLALRCMERKRRRGALYPPLQAGLSPLPVDEG